MATPIRPDATATACSRKLLASWTSAQTPAPARDQHNRALLQRQADFLALGQGLLVGWSRKSTMGALTGRPVQGRLAATAAAALAPAHSAGARILRVHEVAATVDALKVWQMAGLADGPVPV